MKLKVTIDQKVYEVEVEASEPEQRQLPPVGYLMQPAAVRVPAAPAAAPAGGAPVENEDKVCRSPISGIVVRVTAQAGQSIQTGDIILVLEAMKMETNITAPIAGKISKINVAAGDSVQAGAVLVEFE
ncbi:MAG: biotin/lipoyl-binding protein [Acidobacteria bacterium]|nr:biotin/lipoyl-binding protein [Acidobacteriota bacterium]